MCILLVEDDVLIRLSLAEELKRKGFDVCEAESGDQAAAVIQDSKTTLTLLVTDIHMPGLLSGLDVARLMRTRYPGVPVIYMTGRPEVLGEEAGSGTTEALLQKPFVLSELVAAVRRLNQP